MGRDKRHPDTVAFPLSSMVRLPSYKRTHLDGNVE